MSDLKYTAKDSVFSFIFSQPENMCQLYLALHPEDTDITDSDIRLVTPQHILTSGLTNDLGMLVRDALIFLIEAQSTFSRNISLRILLYLAATYKEYIEEHEYNLYSTRPAAIPRPELYMVYVGPPCDLPDVLHLSDLYPGSPGDLEVTVHVLRDSGTNSIIDQYIHFSRICDEQRKIHGYTEEAVAEILRICREENILMPFLLSREKEVRDTMVTLFSQEYATKMYNLETRREALAEGMQKGHEERSLANLRSMMKNTGWPLEKALAVLDVPEEEWPMYRERLYKQ